jgi:dTDP-glucose pyrophosphorylase
LNHVIKQIKQTCVSVSRRLIDAIGVIDAGGMGIALVTDGDGRLVGTLTDGDIRRAILKGAPLESPLEPHVHRGVTSVGPDAGRAEVLDLMQALTLDQIPVLDKDRKLVGIHLLHEIIGAKDRPNWAVVMAGGRGTRLAPITENVPKPMVRVAGRPILERLILHLVGYGIRRVFLSVNYLAQVIIDHFGDGARFGCRIEYLRESQPLGTGGSLSLLPEAPTHPLVVLNGDLVTQVNFGELLDFHDRGGFAATMGVRQYAHQVPFGCVEVDGTRVARMEEKPLLERLVNAGIYAINPPVLARVPKSTLYPITSLFEECLERGEKIGAFEIDDDWLDVGHRDQLRQAQQGH